jgi:hypothetical protein
MKLLGRVNTKLLAQLSIALNFTHIALMLTLPSFFLPAESAAFPLLAQILMWIEFFLAFIVVLRPIDKLITANAYRPSDVESISITITGSTQPEPKRSLPNANTWTWAMLTLLSFVVLVLVTFHLHPPKV